MTSPYECLENLHQLDPNARCLLEILSFCYEPIWESELLQTAFRVTKQTGVWTSNWAESLGVLKRLELVESKYVEVACRREIIEEISVRSMREGRGEAICRELLPNLNRRLRTHYSIQPSFIIARIRLYLGDQDQFVKEADIYSQYEEKASELGIPAEKGFFERIRSGILTREPLDFFPSQISFILAYTAITSSVELGDEKHGICFRWLEELSETTHRAFPFLSEHLMAEGRWDEAEAELAGVLDPEVNACLAVARGEEPEDENLECASVHLQDRPLLGFFLAVHAVKAKKAELLESVIRLQAPTYRLTLRLFAEALEKSENPSLLLSHKSPAMQVFIRACTLYWSGFRSELESLPLDEAMMSYKSSGLHFLAEQLQVLCKIRDGLEVSTPFLNNLAPPEPWIMLLQGLSKLTQVETSRQKIEQRFAWELNFKKKLPLTARLQKIGKTGAWTPGKKIPLDSLSSYYPHCMDEHDRKAYERYLIIINQGGGGVEDLIHALVEHPRICDSGGRNILLQRGNPELSVSTKEDGFILESPLRIVHGLAFRALGPTQIEVSELTDDLVTILTQTARYKGVSIPFDQEPRVTEILERVASRGVHLVSDRELGSTRTEAADSTLAVRLKPEGLGLRASVVVTPLGKRGSPQEPGKGGEFLGLHHEGELITYRRDLKRERKLWRSLRKQIPQFSSTEILFKEPVECLELIEKLSEMPPSDLRVEWPEGVVFKLKKKAEWRHFGLTLRQTRDWLEVQGELPLSETERLSLEDLLEHHRSQKNRFIKLGNGEFLALSEEFHRRLDSLERANRRKGAGGVELHSLSASILLQGGHIVQADTHWEDILRRIQEAEGFEPQLPESVQAELRPYQLEGFKWMARSAKRGVGCCLADDMGLGKTLQTLALISSHPGKAPSLIVAPTSVCSNWLAEMERFTPDLRPRLFAETERESALDNLSGKDVVIVSYGLLVREVEKFQQISWTNLVLDEAQAIKNPDTQRFKAAVALKADFRLATTGTPVENRLDEIWALFEFLNPGLLGTRKAFDQAYSGADDSEQKRESLRRLLAPFILRRLKSEVLQDLPPRTDVNLEVKLTKEERLHYESLRLHALERLSDAEKQDAITILAEITKLRRACCHPRLVDSTSKLEGSKLKMLLRLLSDLKEGGHRALVFSQFVGHLEMVSAALKTAGFSFLYLDGTTPARTRGKLVKEFQEGDADFFLISLKAGGTGLNLTAANYVVHLDPWWNPAVEDQASDRAHRIGQKQPVTVYRLITKDTIEEQIIALHKEKRDLADQLLAGTDKAAKMSAEELMKLLRESFGG